jgi:hypothetical protein
MLSYGTDAKKSLGVASLVIKQNSGLDLYILILMATESSMYLSRLNMIQNMLSYGTDAKKSQLPSQLYFKDKTGHYDDNDVNNGVNTSMYTRSLYFGQSSIE